MTQYQLLLAVRSNQNEAALTINDIADLLLLRHNSVVELVDRVEASRLLKRRRDRDDGRVVRLHLTAQGAIVLERLARSHISELKQIAKSVEVLHRTLERSLPDGES